jgi:hypothetical protein
MEAMLGISLYSYLHLKLAKMICLFHYLLCFLFSIIGEEEGKTGSAQKCVCVGTTYTHVSRYKNNKIKADILKIYKIFKIINHQENANQNHNEI